MMRHSNKTVPATTILYDDEALTLGQLCRAAAVHAESDSGHGYYANASRAKRRRESRLPTPSVQFSFATFTQIADNPRFRSVLNFNISWKVVGDFKFSIQVNNSHDSDPPGTDSNNNDLTLVTAIGYTF